MNARTWFGFNRLALVAALALGSVGGLRAQDQGPSQDAAQDPPDRIARVSFLRGDVSLQPGSPNGDAAFAAAEVNYTLSAGDRLYTGQDGMSELQSDNMALRLGRLSDVTLENFSQEYVQLGLAQGSLRVRSYALQTNSAIEIDTANGAFTVTRAGDVRVSSYPGYGQRPDTTIVTVNAGEVRAVGSGMDAMVESGQVLRVDGENPAQPQLVEMLPADELDAFDQQRDEQRAAAAEEIRDQYVNPGMVGYDDLTAYGDWAPSPEYGRVWYPRQIEAGWSPYHNGHWAYIAPWGYTWVEAEPWGFAPFHYGRWAQFGGRWGWVPGPPVVRPIYSPALVAFVGGSGFSVSVRIGGGGGGVAAWFPLGPREPFVPWYRASPGYVNRVNVSNIYNRNTVEVRNVYVNRTTNVYVNNTTIKNITYVNRTVGTVAVPQQAFERGQQVRAAQVRVDPRQMQQAQVMTRPPEVAARPAPTVGLAPARALPPVQGRPQFQSRGPAAQGTGPQRNGGNGSVAQRFGQPVRPAPAVQAGSQVRPQVQSQVPVAPPTRVEARPVPAGQVQGPTQVRGPDLPQNQQQQPGRAPGGQDIAAPVGGGGNARPAQPLGPRPPAPVATPAPVLQGPTQVRTPGGMRAPNAGTEVQPNQQRPAPQPVPQGVRPEPSQRPQQLQAPPEKPQQTPAPQREIPRQERPAPPPQPQVRPQPAPQPQVRPQARPTPPPPPQRQPPPAPKPAERKEEPK